MSDTAKRRYAILNRVYDMVGTPPDDLTRIAPLNVLQFSVAKAAANDLGMTGEVCLAAVHTLCLCSAKATDRHTAFAYAVAAHAFARYAKQGRAGMSATHRLNHLMKALT